jgi:hypothetical protein
MSPCIYCGAPADSREHWLPRCLGAIEGLAILEDRLCEGCNHALGRELDEALARTGPTAYSRALHGIRGRRQHSEVNLFLYRASSRQQPTTLLRPAPHGQYQILGEAYTDEQGRKNTRPLRQLVLKTPAGDIERVPFPPAYDATLIKKMLAERGLEDAELVEIYLDEDELAEGPESSEALDLRRLLSAVFGAFRGAQVWYGKGESSLAQVELKAGIKSEYLRALAKVGFHYFLSTSRRCTGAEPEFAPLRQFIRHGEGEWPSFVQLNAPQFIPELANGLVPRQTSHFFYVEQDIQALAWIQFFVGPDDLPPPTLIRLGNSPSHVHGRSLSCHLVTYFGERIEGFDAVIEEVPVTAHDAITP